MSAIRIAPSILSADFARLGEEVRAIETAGADLVHFDVMDNHYVPNLTIGPLVCEAIRPHVTIGIDVHLMVEPVDALIPLFAKAGANLISFHPEASRHVDRTLQLIRDHGCKAGLVFNPATPLAHMDHVLDKLDLVLLMSVNPGFGGQKFITSTLDKLRDARRRIDAVKAETGREIWHHDMGMPVINAPLVSGGRVFFSTYDNHFYALAADDGRQLWDHQGIAEPAGILVSTNAAAAGATVIVPYTSGEIFALQAQNGQVGWSDVLSRSGQVTALSLLDDVPSVLPALSRAKKLQGRAARVGFDWPDALPVLDKVREELDEVLEAISEGRAHREGRTEVDGRTVERIRLDPMPECRLPGCDSPTYLYVDPEAFEPVRLETPAGYINYPGQSPVRLDVVVRYQTYEYLPPTPANLALTDIRAQHPNATEEP